ncbi:MAG: polysaccharide deacetylase family protein [Lachnospiraceae bacterium]
MAQHEEEQLQKKRRKRVNRLKKIIVTVVLAAILIPTAVSICLGIRLHVVNGRLEQAWNEQEVLRNRLDELSAEVDGLRNSTLSQEQEMAAEEDGTILESESSVQDVTSADGIKRVYLTFDDGPSANTAAILDLLAEYQVKATFFVVGDTSEEGKALYRRIVSEGHSIGIHSYSHIYKEIYASEDAFFEDFYLMSDYLYDITGIRPTICRLPGGSSNTVSSIDMSDVVNELNEQGVSCYDWNISGGDADGHDLSAEEIAENVLTGVDRFQTSIVLLHDGGGKAVTVDALRIILEELTDREQLEIKPITEETPVILHITH